MFLGSVHYGDAQDTIFWGILYLGTLQIAIAQKQDKDK
jgi:hypothetical protein